MSSINWNLADGTIEVVKTSDGLVHEKDLAGEDVARPSRLCKQKLSELMLTVCERTKTDVESPVSYESLKAGAVNYNAAKKEFISWLRQNNIGIWQRKPRDFQMFYVK